MCGIAGIVGANSEQNIDAVLVRKMCQAIVHRGPDDEGVYAAGPAALGMRRLSIIDVSGGQQPIHNEDRTVWIVFNGEIYNFLELRPELEKAGHRFYTQSDTEVVVHLYEQYGADCVRKLRGMFAFAIYDFKRSKLLLARDRLGKKPLHYAVVGSRLLFGSEIKSLLAVAPELRELDTAAQLQYFQYGYIHEPLTAFKNISKLPAASWLEYSGGTVKVQQYWDVPQFGTRSSISEEECLEQLEREFENAVRMRLISEVPLGALLSGGVDSSAVVAMMARVSNSRVRTFSIGFGKSDFNEAPYARAVAEKFGTEHHEITVDPNLWETLNELTARIDEPFGDSSMVPTYHVSQMARRYVTVALAGDGGDELFAGYDRYLAHYNRRHLDLIPSWAGDIYRRAVYPLLPSSVRGRKLAYNVGLKARDRFADAMTMLATRDKDLSVLSTEFAQAAQCGCEDSLLSEVFDQAPATDLVSRMQYVDIKTYMNGDILTKVDRMSMLASLEVRAPLLDHVFVELATAMPTHMKLRGRTQKFILRKLAERLGVPTQVLYRRKQGFSMPLVHWLRGEMKREVTEILLEPRTVQRGYYRRAGVERLLDEHHRGLRDHSNAIWTLLVYELWHRNFLEAKAVIVPALHPVLPEGGRQVARC